MQTRQVVLRERCAPVTVFARRRRFLFGATATGELGIPPLARAVRLAAVCGVLVALSASPARAQPCIPAPPDLVHWWPLDEPEGPVAKDIISGSNGAYVNGPIPVPGYVDWALRTGGAIGAHVNVSSGSATLDVTPAGFTIAAWYKCPSPCPTNPWLSVVQKSDFTTGYMIWVDASGALCDEHY